MSDSSSTPAPPAPGAAPLVEVDGLTPARVAAVLDAAASDRA